MALRYVTAADGREWELKSSISWDNPVTADDFEHDVAGGYTPVVVMSVVLFLLVVVLIAWTPESVSVPSWLVLILVLLFAAFPTRWALRRPWSLVASTKGDRETGQPAETWVGTVRGPISVRSEADKVARNIEDHSLPDPDGVLQPVE